MYVRLGSPYLVAMLVGAARMYWNLSHFDGWMIIIILDGWMIFINWMNDFYHLDE